MSSELITREQLERIQMDLDEFYSMISGDQEMREVFLESIEIETE